MQIFVAGKGEHVGLVAAGVGHEPDTHFNDYAEGRLREDAVVVGPETVVEEVPGAVAGAVVRRNLLEIYFVSGTAWLQKVDGGVTEGSESIVGSGRAPIPVRISSPEGRTTSRPQCIIQWSFSSLETNFDLRWNLHHKEYIQLHAQPHSQ